MIHLDPTEITIRIDRDGRISDPGPPAAEPVQATVPDMAGNPGDAGVLAAYRSSPNPLLNASADLMALAAILRRVQAQPEIGYARSTVARAIIELKYRVVGADFPPSVAENLCLLYAIAIDEFVLLSPWGAGSGWENRSLCADLFGFRDGGERFFQITERALLQPRALAPFLEVVYILLKLGFTGRFTGPLEHERERLIARIEHMGLGADAPPREIRPGRPAAATRPPRARAGLAARLCLSAAALALIAAAGWAVRTPSLAASRAAVAAHQARIASAEPIEYVFDSASRQTRVGVPE